MSSPGLSSCPELDFSACLPTQLTPSPRPRRARGAPWASRCPRPYVDPPDRVSPGLRTSALPKESSRAPFDNVTLEAPAILNTLSPFTDASKQSKEDDLLQMLFPELRAATQRAVLDTLPPLDVSGSPHTSFDALEHEGAPIQPSNQSGRLFSSSSCPVTPERPSFDQQAGSRHVQPVNDLPRTVLRSLKSLNVYSSRKGRRSLERTRAVRELQCITGIDTEARVKARLQRSQHEKPDSDEEEQDAEEADEDINGPSPVETESMPSVEYVEEGSRNGRSMQQNHSTSACQNLTRSATHTPPEDKAAQLQPITKELKSATSPQKRARSVVAVADYADNFLDTLHQATQDAARSQQMNLSQSAPPSAERPEQPRRIRRPTTRSRNQGDEYTEETAQEAPNGKHDKHKQFVYERVLEYPHRRYDDDLRPGYKALNMGYVVPPPKDKPRDHVGDDDDYHEYRSIREMKLKILGRASQTEFRALQAIKGANTRNPARKKNKTAKQRQEEDDYELQQAELQGMKPISHLKAHTMLKKQLREELQVREVYQQQTDTSKHKARRALKQSKGRQKVNKKSRCLPGHRPLLLRREGTSLHEHLVDSAVVEEHDGQQVDPHPSQLAIPTPRQEHPEAPISTQSPLPQATTSVVRPAAEDMQDPRLQASATAGMSVAGATRPQPPKTPEPNICDILMPLSSHGTQKRLPRTFSLGTTVITRAGSRHALAYESFDDDSRASPSDAGLTESTAGIHATLSLGRDVSLGRRVLAPSSSNGSVYDNNNEVQCSLSDPGKATDKGTLRAHTPIAQKQVGLNAQASISARYSSQGSREPAYRTDIDEAGTHVTASRRTLAPSPAAGSVMNRLAVHHHQPTAPQSRPVSQEEGEIYSCCQYALEPDFEGEMDEATYDGEYLFWQGYDNETEDDQGLTQGEGDEVTPPWLGHPVVHKRHDDQEDDYVPGYSLQGASQTQRIGPPSPEDVIQPEWDMEVAWANELEQRKLLVAEQTPPFVPPGFRYAMVHGQQQYRTTASKQYRHEARPANAIAPTFLLEANPRDPCLITQQRLYHDEMSSIPPAADTPQSDTVYDDITLENKLDAYGRKVVDLQALYINPDKPGRAITQSQAGHFIPTRSSELLQHGQTS